METPHLRTVVLDVAADEMRNELRRAGVADQTIAALGADRTAIADGQLTAGE